jgi:SAM-dependent methyltransferase
LRTRSGGIVLSCSEGFGQVHVDGPHYSGGCYRAFSFSGFLPVLEPFAAGVLSILWKLIGYLFKAVPGLLNGAGVVAKDGLDLANGTCDKLVQSIEQWKASEKTKPGEGSWPALKIILDSTLSLQQKTQVYQPQSSKRVTETSKAMARRRREGFFDRYFVGKGIDIGCGSDPLAGCDKWDKEQGDATFMAGVEDESYDFVYSSHALEHVDSPEVALQNWWRILKPGGHLIVGVPDEDLYEQGVWPSRWNGDHKTTWTVNKDKSWSPVSKNVTQVLDVLPNRRTVMIRVVDEGYDYAKSGIDQSVGRAEVLVEFIVQKRKE